jgi:hypothetical protein
MSQVVSQLIDAGVMLPGTDISAEYRGKRLQATITPDGQVDFRGAIYKSPSAAGAAAKQFVSGKYLATDGWTFWHYVNHEGSRVPLSVARDNISKSKRLAASDMPGATGFASVLTKSSPMPRSHQAKGQLAFITECWSTVF